VIDAGDIHLADLNEEVRRRVLVLSNARFNSISGRALVAPEVFGEPDEVPFPWRLVVDSAVYAVDLARTMPVSRLLERVDRAPAAAVAHARRTLAHIT
jgi:mRNA-degrading endonuclease toxin of MazEF toxin-antitoxin module